MPTTARRGDCRGCGDDYPLILGVVQAHRVDGVPCAGAGKAPAGSGSLTEPRRDEVPLTESGVSADEV